MGQFLTYRGSAKANTTTGALPDENYARESMQLFTIGLVQLELDATPKLTAGQPTDTYGQADITGLARVFTGWDYDLSSSTAQTPDYVRRPMAQVASRYESGAKTFLGTTIPAGTAATQSLTLALDAIAAHPNVAPFFSRQLIQRLVTSNPSPAYVARISAVFNDDGTGARGNLRAVLRALLLDTEARTPSSASAYGKLREPMLRFVAWARAFGAISPSGQWNIGNTSDAAKGLAQSPLRSPSVFNFFRPGYVPPNSALGSASLVAPEFQIANESSVVGFINFMQRAVAGSVGDITPDYASLVPLADDAKALVDELNLVLAANQLAAVTTAMLTTRCRPWRAAPTPRAAPASTPRSCWCSPRPSSSSRSEGLPHHDHLIQQRFASRLPAARLGPLARRRRHALGAEPRGDRRGRRRDRLRLQGAGLRVSLRRQRLRQHAHPVRQQPLRALPGHAPDARLRAQRARRDRARAERRIARRDPVRARPPNSGRCCRSSMPAGWA